MNLVPATQMGMELIEFDGKYFKRRNVSADLDTWYLVCDHCKKGTAILNHVTGLCRLNKKHTDECFVDAQKYAARTVSALAKHHYANNPRVTPTIAIDEGRTAFTQQHGAGHLVQGVTVSKSTLKRARAAKYPPPPHTFADVPFVDTFPEHLCYVKDALNNDQPFLMVNQVLDNVPNAPDARILGFSTPTDLRRLALADKIYLDGTFKVTPNPFYQLFTINSMATLDVNRSVLFPRVYFLLPNKSGNTYQQAMQIVVDLIAQAHVDAGTPDAPIHWTHVSCDYESGLLQAIPTIRTNPLGPPIVVDGCHFHYCSAIFKKATTGPFSMLADYSNPDNLLRIFLQYIYALPLLREEDMFDAFMDVIDQRCPPTLIGTPRMTHFLEYVMDIWITKIWLVLGIIV